MVREARQLRLCPANYCPTEFEGQDIDAVRAADLL
jgi:hypothetical protein